MILIITLLLLTQGLHCQDITGAIDIIKHCEVYSSTPYMDLDSNLAIGYGYKVNVRYGQFMSEIEASNKMVEDLRCRIKRLNKLVKVKLNNNQLNALLSLVYNIGIGNFARSDLLRKLNKGNYELESEFMRWIYVRCRNQECDIENCKKKQGGLVKRRIKEWKLFNLNEKIK
ncbi:hypothetical protein LCGC14_0342670 [marine sediment metagenome]|uniref:Lysozyme n=1 Tax=marine sediment metagenome TaxID=412755 RepID=A0A0F9TJ14_9ZZZZ